jgi:hypothetical protein
MLPILKGLLSFCNRLLVPFFTSLIHPTFQTLSLSLHCLYFTFLPSVAFFTFGRTCLLSSLCPSFFFGHFFVFVVTVLFLYPLYFRVSCSFGLLSVRAAYIFNAGPHHHIYSAITGEPYKITPCSRSLLEKLICPHVVKKQGVLYSPLAPPE